MFTPTEYIQNVRKFYVPLCRYTGSFIITSKRIISSWRKYSNFNAVEYHFKLGRPTKLNKNAFKKP